MRFWNLFDCKLEWRRGVENWKSDVDQKKQNIFFFCNDTNDLSTIRPI